MKQTHQIRCLDFIVNNGSITSKQAFEELGNTRLSATINVLRNNGYDIVTTIIEVTTRFKNSDGKTKNTKVAMYTLSTYKATSSIKDKKIIDSKSLSKAIKDKIFFNIFKSK